MNCFELLIVTHLWTTSLVNYCPQLRKGNVFTSVCQECFPRGEGVHQSGHTHLPPGQTLAPLPNIPQFATAVDSTHPIGMHSCYHPKWSWGKVIYFYMCLWFSSWGEGSAPLHAGIHRPPPGTRGRHPHREQTNPRTRGRHPLGPCTPQRSACWEVQATSGRYASYWNVILFNMCPFWPLWKYKSTVLHVLSQKR